MTITRTNNNVLAPFTNFPGNCTPIINLYLTLASSFFQPSLAASFFSSSIHIISIRFVFRVWLYYDFFFNSPVYFIGAERNDLFIYFRLKLFVPSLVHCLAVSKKLQFLLCGETRQLWCLFIYLFFFYIF